MPTTPEHNPDTPRCTHCPRLLHADELDHYACHACEDRATTQLRAMPDLYEQLATVLAPGSAQSDSVRVTGATPTPPLPVALQPLTLRGPGGIVSVLLEIEQRWRAHLDWDPLPLRGGYEKSLSGTVKFLVNNVPWACDDYAEIAADLDTIGTLHGQAQRSVTGIRPRLIPVTCLAVYDDGTQCGARLRIDINKPLACCRECGARWGREEWVRLYEATMPRAA